MDSEVLMMSDLDEAAEATYPETASIPNIHVREAFKLGAEWQAERDAAELDQVRTTRDAYGEELDMRNEAFNRVEAELAEARALNEMTLRNGRQVLSQRDKAEAERDALAAQLDEAKNLYAGMLFDAADDLEKIHTLEAEKFILDTKLDQVRAWLGTEDDWAEDLEGSWPAPIELKRILDTAPEPEGGESK